MGLSERFEDLPVWQAAADLYGFAEGLLREPELGASPGWRDQFERAALAISSHVARGVERGLSAGERLAAVNQARGAVAEVRSMLRVLERRKVAREVQVPVARLKALADSCTMQLRAHADSLGEGAGSAVSIIAARPPEFRPPQSAHHSSSEIRRKTVEVARKILGILPNYRA